MELILQQEQLHHPLLLARHLVAHGVILMVLGQLILLVLVELNHVHVQSLVQELAKRLIAHITLRQAALQRQELNLVALPLVVKILVGTTVAVALILMLVGINMTLAPILFAVFVKSTAVVDKAMVVFYTHPKEHHELQVF